MRPHVLTCAGSSGRPSRTIPTPRDSGDLHLNDELGPELRPRPDDCRRRAGSRAFPHGVRSIPQVFPRGQRHTPGFPRLPRKQGQLPSAPPCPYYVIVPGLRSECIVSAFPSPHRGGIMVELGMRRDKWGFLSRARAGAGAHLVAFHWEYLCTPACASHLKEVRVPGTFFLCPLWPFLLLEARTRTWRAAG